ncbi:MAG: hypothetical protein WC755_00680 [Candidatus Woesearchaeota archaeon]|jgi:hypothetical protein
MNDSSKNKLEKMIRKSYFSGKFQDTIFHSTDFDNIRRDELTILNDLNKTEKSNHVQLHGLYNELIKIYLEIGRFKMTQDIIPVANEFFPEKNAWLKYAKHFEFLFLNKKVNEIETMNQFGRKCCYYPHEEALTGYNNLIKTCPQEGHLEIAMFYEKLKDSKNMTLHYLQALKYEKNPSLKVEIERALTKELSERSR